MSGFRQKLALWGAALEKRTPREKILLVVAALAIVYLAVDVLALSPLKLRQKAVQQSLKTAAEQVPQLEAQIVALTTKATQDPDQDNRRQLEALRAQVAEMDARLQALTLDLIPPREMSRVLQEILHQQKGVRLVKAENLPPEPLLTVEPDAQGEGTERPNVYRHGLRLEFAGTYPQILATLKALEGVKRQLLWTSLELQVVDYPQSRVVLTVHTLSLSKEWIGV